MRNPLLFSGAAVFLLFARAACVAQAGTPDFREVKLGGVR